MRVEALLHDIFEPDFGVTAVEDATNQSRHGKTLVKAAAINHPFPKHAVSSTDEAVARMHFGWP